MGVRWRCRVAAGALGTEVAIARLSLDAKQNGRDLFKKEILRRKG